MVACLGEDVVGSQVEAQATDAELAGKRLRHGVAQGNGLNLPIRTVDILRRLVTDVVVILRLVRTREVVRRILRCPVVEVGREVGTALRVVCATHLIVDVLSPTGNQVDIQVKVLVAEVIVESGSPLRRRRADVRTVVGRVDDVVAVQILQFEVARFERLRLLGILEVSGSFLTFAFLPNALVDVVVERMERTTDEQALRLRVRTRHDVRPVNQVGDFFVVGCKGDGRVPAEVFRIEIHCVDRHFDTLVHRRTDVLVHLERSVVRCTQRRR